MLLCVALVAVFVAASPVPAAPAPEPLSFREFFEPSPKALEPSARLLSLVGRRVRLSGYMAHMEAPASGGFFLCSLPVVATEAGAGTADLPPDAVFVVVRSAHGKPLAHVAGLLQVTGALELGPQTDEDGRLSRLRVVLDGPAPRARASAPRR